MPTYLFYPRRADGVSLTFIAETASNDVEALSLASEIAQAHDCAGVFVWAPAVTEGGADRFVGEMNRAVNPAARQAAKAGAKDANASL